MGQAQVKYARFIGEEKPGQTRCLRSEMIPDGEDLQKDFKGMSTIQEIYE